jgi:hypothetical protein
MKRIHVIALVTVCLVVSALAGGLTAFLTTPDPEVQQGAYFDDLTVDGDVDVYGEGVIRDSRDQTVRAQVTGGGLMVQGVMTSPNIYGGYSGNAVADGLVGAFIGGGGTTTDGEWGSGVQVNVVSGHGHFSTIGGGLGNSVYGRYATVGGGARQIVQQGGYYSFIGGGTSNEINFAQSTIAGGYDNTDYGSYSFIGGGSGNQTSQLSVIAGGSHNHQTVGINKAIGGGAYNTIGTGNPNTLEFDWLRNLGGGAGDYSAISGGKRNAIGDTYSVIGGGFENKIVGSHTLNVSHEYLLEDSATGCLTSTHVVTCSSTYNGIFSGYANEISNARVFTEDLGTATQACQVDGYAFIGGGISNTIASTIAQVATIAGGGENSITATYGTVAGGYQNQVTGLYGAVPGGTSNTAAGAYSFAAGRGARALHDGSFVWADSGTAVYSSTVANSFNVSASGGVNLDTDGAGLDLDGPITVDGMDFTYTDPITISGVLTNVRLLYYQVP